MSKSKKEIVNETLDYVESNGMRASETTPSGGTKCFYNYVIPEGEENAGRFIHCAVGRCMDQSHYDKSIESEAVSPHHTPGNYSNLDEILKPEYKGHHQSFWSHLQTFHDMSSNWNDDGTLNNSGKEELEDFLAKIDKGVYEVR